MIIEPATTCTVSSRDRWVHGGADSGRLGGSVAGPFEAVPWAGRIRFVPARCRRARRGNVPDWYGAERDTCRRELVVNLQRPQRLQNRTRFASLMENILVLHRVSVSYFFGEGLDSAERRKIHGEEGFLVHRIYDVSK